MSEGKTKVILVQLGSPENPSPKAVKKFLKEFLADKRVVDINPYLWKFILYCFILPFRPKKSAELYSRIWDGESFPLITITKKFSHKIKSLISHEKIEVDYAFLLSNPKINTIWNEWEMELKSNPLAAKKIKVIPLFPQYAEATIASGIDALFLEVQKRSIIPEISILTNFHTSKAFIDSSVSQIEKNLNAIFSTGKKIDKLLLTFHGIQKRRINEKGDQYYLHCFETYFLIKEKIKNFPKDKIIITFQSRFGSEEWLTPYTEDTVLELIKNNEKEFALYSPSFVADCLETLDELGHELKIKANEHGGNINFIPSLNDNDDWCNSFAKFIENQCVANQETRELDFYQLNQEDYKEFKQMSEKELKQISIPLTKEAKSSIFIVALTIFLDIVGFSIIFPLFPSLAKYYLAIDSNNIFLKAIYAPIEAITNLTASSTSPFSSVVLFGGILGAIYSILQFIASPLWGAWSDKIGRKPILTRSMLGMSIGYLIWIFSGSFTLLIISRIIDGIMGGNISTATAVVADVTTKENRSKGMAIIGISFALGFVVGPAIGGMLSLIDLTKIFPSLTSYGINPFSVPALFAFILSLFNAFWISTRFKESLTEEKRGIISQERVSNIFKLFKPLPIPGVNKINLSYFLFLSAFSGMEFTLTFLAAERLNYTSMKNAYIFIFIGFVIAFVQGGFVRRKAHIIGEKKVALIGMLTLIPGLLSIALAYSNFVLYLGLFFLAIGSSMIMPCLTSLVTLYTPSDFQGRSVGIFRSMGALARVVGPIFASILYYKYGSAAPYYIGACFILLPILLLKTLQKTTQV